MNQVGAILNLFLEVTGNKISDEYQGKPAKYQNSMAMEPTTLRDGE